MGGFNVMPGATSPEGFARQDSAEAATIDGPRRTGRGFEVGDPWIDQGGHGHCYGLPQTAGCFLPEDHRAALINEFRDNVLVAQHNYNLALAEIEVKELVTKPDDLPWFVGLALDAASMYLGYAFAGVVMKGLGPMLSGLEARAWDHAQRGISDPSWRVRAETALRQVTPRRVEGIANSALAPGKLAAKSALAGKIDRHTNFLDELKSGCDIAFHEFKQHACANVDDATLVVLNDGMQPQYHDIGKYKAALEEKLARYRKSGALDIGENTTQLVEGKLHFATRVVYVQDLYGRPRPWFQKRVGDSYGTHHNEGDWQLDRPVPDEFAQVAIDHSTTEWGSIPTLSNQSALYDAFRVAVGHYTDPSDPKNATTSRGNP
jgi:hypothetical protein